MHEKYLETGKIVSTHGIRGEIKVLPWADSPEFLTRFKTFYLVGAAIGRLQTGEVPVALPVEHSRVQKTCVLIKFRGVDSVEAAETLRGRVLLIDRDDPAVAPGTVFQADLIGLPVYADGAQIGTIAEILNMPASEVWIVRGEHEYMIPNVKAFVPFVDPALGRVDVTLIEGMRTDAD